MELIKPGTNIPFLKYRPIAIAVSAILIFGALLTLILHGGPNYGIDFAGGILIQVKFHTEVKTAALRDVLMDQGYGQVVVQQFGNQGARVPGAGGKDGNGSGNPPGQDGG